MEESNTEETDGKCPNCGADLDPAVAQGLCPRCALAEVANEPAKSATQSGAFTVPSSEELGKAFPQFKILELIGHGGMGAVYKVHQKNLNRIVALKILPETLADSPEFQERFILEAQLPARLNHPNIVTVHDFGKVDGFFYLIMEYVDGVNLREAMRAGRFTPEQALEIVPKICEALQFAHEEGVLHRDIKPENILIDSKGRVKIADFGIAKLIGDSALGGQGLTGSMVPGTPQYMAPEQIEHPDEVDHRADIYSLGVVFYEMLTGELPLGRFAAPSEKASVDSQVDEIVFRALEKERQRRQQSADEVKTEVVAATVARRRHPAYAIPATGNKRCRNGGLAALALFLVAAGIVLGTLFLLVPFQNAGLTRARQMEAVVTLQEIMTSATKAQKQIAESRQAVERLEKERNLYTPGQTSHTHFNNLIAKEKTEQQRLQKYIELQWERKSLLNSSRPIAAGVLESIVFSILVLLGTILGWKALRRHRLIGESRPASAIAAGVAATIIPILLVDICILRLFRNQDLALLTIIVLDSAMIWWIWKWLKTPPSTETRKEFADTTHRSVPWWGWLIISLLLTPGILFGLYIATKKPPPSKVIQQIKEPAGMFAPVTHADPSLDSDNEFKTIITLQPRYLVALEVYVRDAKGKSHSLNSAQSWAANSAHSGKPTGQFIRWKVTDSTIELIYGNEHDLRTMCSPPLPEFARTSWQAIRPDRSWWFTHGSDDEWKIGEANEHTLFTDPEGCEIYLRATCYPMDSKAMPAGGKQFQCNDQWRTMIAPTKP